MLFLWHLLPIHVTFPLVAKRDNRAPPLDTLDTLEMFWPDPINMRYISES